jgi:outer membrane receptor protein involved in Fe transport
VLRFKHSDTLSFEGGAETAFNYRDGRTSFTRNGEAVPIPNASVRVEERRGEGFATATWRPFSTLGVEAGSRFEFSTISSSGGAESERSFFYPKPRLLFTWTPNNDDTFRLRLEREVGQLNFGDFVASADLTEDRVVAGNPSLEPDKTTVIEVSAERRFWEKGSISLAYSHERITDVIDRLPITALNDRGETFVFDAPGNIGDGVQNELDLNLTLPLDRFGVPGGELKVEAEVVESEVTDPTTGEPRRISGQRPRELELNFGRTCRAGS